ncbi:hypothetical protein GTO27_13080 [Candidatus Bathyarchaeota archaeon]|nr:hypothetical protein [Candidatus Bathyarchaeota archaeon]
MEDSQEKLERVERYRTRLDQATEYGKIWEIVKDTVSFTLRKRRGGMMLFLDDLPIRLGAYHPLGTNNIVLNRILVNIVEEAVNSRRVVNALVYNLLLHEYLHALGQYSEGKVRQLVHHITTECFGEGHIATTIAKESPWTLLRKIPLKEINVPRRVMEIVKDFEKADRYIV